MPKNKAISYKGHNQNRVLMTATDTKNHCALITLHSPAQPAATLGISLPVDVLEDVIADLNERLKQLLEIA